MLHLAHGIFQLLLQRIQLLALARAGEHLVTFLSNEAHSSPHKSSTTARVLPKLFLVACMERMAMLYHWSVERQLEQSWEHTSSHSQQCCYKENLLKGCAKWKHGS